MQADRDGVDVVCELANESREHVEKIQRAIMDFQLEQADLDRKVKIAKKPVTKFKTQETRFQKSLDSLKFKLEAKGEVQTPSIMRFITHDGGCGTKAVVL